MIEKLKINTNYYCGTSISPFYKKVYAININSDGTYDNKDAERYSTVSFALEHWCYTKEEAIQDIIDLYLKKYHNVDMSGKSELHIIFEKDMSEYLKKSHPEYFL